VIQSIRHKGLRLYYEEGKGSKLPREQLSKLNRFLSALDAIASEDDIRALGNGIHPLKGKYKGYWSLTVTGNYPLIFRWESPDIHDVDYIDYH
jgi:proteic killer suppression protein